MSRFANCNYQVLQIRSSYKQRLEQWRSTSLKLGIAKFPEHPDWPPHRISKYRNCTAVAVAVFLYLEILGGGGASPDTLTFSEKTITYRLTLRTFRGGPVGILYFFFELVIFRGGPVKKITLYDWMASNSYSTP